MTLYRYRIAIKKEGKQFYAYRGDFPGVYGLGKTIEVAKLSFLEAMQFHSKYSHRSA